MLPRPENIADAVLVTHQGCMDGSGCAIMFVRAGGKRENVHYVAAGMMERFLKKNMPDHESKFVIFADIGINEASHDHADELQKRGNCVLIDHHRTSQHLSGRDWCDIRMEACGTELFRQYLGLEDPSSKALAVLIQDHDLWLRQDPDSEKLASFTVFAGQDVFVDRFIDRDVRAGVFSPEENEMMRIVEHRRDGIIESLLKKVKVREVMWGTWAAKGMKVAKVAYIISSEMNVSLLLDRMLAAHPEVDIGCQINVDKGSVSLRSRNGYDVSEFAANFGGGGHKAASGHRLPESILEDIIERIHA